MSEICVITSHRQHTTKLCNQRVRGWWLRIENTPAQKRVSFCWETGAILSPSIFPSSPLLWTHSPLLSLSGTHSVKWFHPFCLRCSNMTFFFERQYSHYFSNTTYVIIFPFLIWRKQEHGVNLLSLCSSSIQFSLATWTSLEFVDKTPLQGNTRRTVSPSAPIPYLWRVWLLEGERFRWYRELTLFRICVAATVF